MAVVGASKVSDIANPPFGVLGGYPGDSGNERVDFELEGFDKQIEMHGQRMAWSRAYYCPCSPINAQSDQADPNCKLCDGYGWSYFGPSEGQDLTGESFSDTQLRAIKQYQGFVVRGLLMGANKMDMPWEKTGAWRSGSASLTVRQDNRINFMDRMVNLDAQVCFNEKVEMPADPTKPLPARYLVSGGVYLVRSLERVFQIGREVFVKQGKLYFGHGVSPRPKTRLSLHYVTFPTWIVQDIPNVSRVTNILDGSGRYSSQEGPPTQMPLRASVRLEFLPRINAEQDGS
jgi:hypothetical protein